MRLLDNVLGSAVPEGSLAKPLMVALTALLAAKVTGSGGLGNLLGGGAASPQTPPTGVPSQPQGTQPQGSQPQGSQPQGSQPQGSQPQGSQPQGGLLGGLSGLLQSFQQSGHGDVINSWVGPGQNQQIAPEQLHQALGPEAVNNLSRLTGVPSNELLSELSRVLPGVVDKLTPQGRTPDHAEMSRW
jgi:uncharacterized protein YidB (DUF937 family)